MTRTYRCAPLRSGRGSDEEAESGGTPLTADELAAQLAGAGGLEAGATATYQVA